MANLKRGEKQVSGEAENAEAHRLALAGRLVRLSMLVAGLNVLAGQNPDFMELQQRLLAHVRLFVQYDHLSKPLTTLTPDKNGVVTVTADFMNDYAAEPLPEMSVEDRAKVELLRLITGSPTIVEGRAIAHRSAFTESKTFICSDWDFEVQRIFKNRGDGLARVGAIVTVTRPGGSLIQDGVTYIAQDRTFPDFHDGNVYILFLQPLPDLSHSFRVFPGYSFLVSGARISRMDDYQKRSSLSERLLSVRFEDFAHTIDRIVAAAGAR